MYEGYKEIPLELSNYPSYELNTNVEYELELLKEGKIALYPNENELFIDIDSEDQYDRFWKALTFIYKNDYMFKFIKIFKKDSKTKGHFHYIIQLPIKIDNLKRIIYQSLLGSDNVREIISYLRYKRGDSFPTIFAERITEKQEITSYKSNNEVCRICGKRYGRHFGERCPNERNKEFIGSGIFSDI